MSETNELADNWDRDREAALAEDTRKLEKFGKLAPAAKGGAHKHILRSPTVRQNHVVSPANLSHGHTLGESARNLPAWVKALGKELDTI